MQELSLLISNAYCIFEEVSESQMCFSSFRCYRLDVHYIFYKYDITKTKGCSSFIKSSPVQISSFVYTTK